MALFGVRGPSDDRKGTDHPLTPAQTEFYSAAA